MSRLNPKIKQDTPGASTGITIPVPINQGGTNATSAQTALDNLTQVSAATTGHVLTKDGSGNATFQAPTGGEWTGSSTNVYLSTTTDDVIIGAATPVSSAKLSVDGDADQRQCVIQGYSTQTANIFEVQKSDGTVNFGVSNTAGITVGGSSVAIGSNTAGSPVQFSTAQCEKVVSLSDGATPALDASLGNIFYLDAAGDRTIAIPTNATSGQKIIIRHYANGGARTLSLNTGAGGFRYGTDITGLTATSSGTMDYIGAIYNSVDSFWDVVAYSKGY